MKKHFFLAAFLLIPAMFAVTLQEKGTVKTISNDHYSLEISNTNGALKSLSFSGKKYNIYASQEFRANGEQKKYSGQYAANAPLINANNSKQTVTVLEDSADQITIRCELKKPFMTSVTTYTFDNSPIIKCRMDAEFQEAPSDWFYTLRLLNFSTEKDSFLLPGKPVPAVPFNWPYYERGKQWKFDIE